MLRPRVSDGGVLERSLGSLVGLDNMGVGGASGSSVADSDKWIGVAGATQGVSKSELTEGCRIFRDLESLPLIHLRSTGT